jgi:hypothetical protein
LITGRAAAGIAAVFAGIGRRGGENCGQGNSFQDVKSKLSSSGFIAVGRRDSEPALTDR